VVLPFCLVTFVKFTWSFDNYRATVTMPSGTPPLSQATGYGVVIGLGFLFA